MTADGGRSTVMRQRIVLGAAALLAMALVFVLDISIAQRAAGWEGPFGSLVRRGSVLPVLFLALVWRGAGELDGLLRVAGAVPHSRFAKVMTAVLFLLPWFSAAGWLGSGPADVEGLLWSLIGVMAAVVGAGMLAIVSGRPERTIPDLSATIFVILYLGFLGSFALQLRCGRDVPEQQGAWLLLVVVLVAKATDIGGYLAGTLFGRHKLIPSVSPGKTWEGLAGGLFLSVAVAVGVAASGSPASFGLLASGADGASGSLGGLFRVAGFAVLVAISGQIGDLLESCLKRCGHKKDSGAILPHYGGILDLLDSPLVAVPVAWFLLTRVWGVV